ncbi:unnamed protein product [Triticum turgidum subsp. durum]|uniref:GH16 domain-containing protein n=1 Tax=Triticum turgidum subsp. durum TaxID=4567 RepID=A0A9R0Y3Z2_TRITD|nr:unnamed protein product [Triticum turgidum subsp. durum]
MAMKAGFLAAAAACVCLAAAAAAFDVPTVAFEEGFSPLFGDGNLVRARDDRAARLLLDRRSGSGFISSDYYLHGFFSASIKLPRDYTAGVVVAFYLSNGDVYEKTHDELDFEFLGSRWGGQWRVQTNVYGNGSTSRGREERYLLPFDPTLEAHRYSILWAPTHIIFYVDDTPIREVVRHPGMGGDFPAKPMAVYATIWDGSAWATEGGKYEGGGVRADCVYRAHEEAAAASAGESGRVDGEHLQMLEREAEEKARQAQAAAAQSDIAAFWNMVFPWAGPAPTLMDLTDPDAAAAAAEDA